MHFILVESMRTNTGITQPTHLRWRLFSKLSLGINTKSECSKLHEFTKFKPWAPKPLSCVINTLTGYSCASTHPASLKTGCFPPVYLALPKDHLEKHDPKTFVAKPLSSAFMLISSLNFPETLQ